MMTSSKISWSQSRNQYLVLKLCKISKPKQRKTLMNTCEELIKQVLAKVK